MRPTKPQTLEKIQNFPPPKKILKFLKTFKFRKKSKKLGENKYAIPEKTQTFTNIEKIQKLLKIMKCQKCMKSYKSVKFPEFPKCMKLIEIHNLLKFMKSQKLSKVNGWGMVTTNP